MVGHRHEEIEEVLKDENVTVVYNEAYDKGMFSSIQKGLSAIDEHMNAFYMHPVDIPLVKGESFERLFETYLQKKGGVVYPIFLGRKGHPPLIDMKYKEHILLSDGEGGLKRVLEAFNKDASYVGVCDQSVLMDMDTKEDYERLCVYEKRNAPTEQECLAIMHDYGVEEHIIAHCQAVEKMLQNILKELSCTSVLFDDDALLVAALCMTSRVKRSNTLK